jgi:hypothetical protein
LQTGKNPALFGKHECRTRYQTDRDSDGRYVLRGNEGSKTES